MDEFVDQTKTLVGALGWDLFREVRGRVTETAQDPEDLPDVRSLGNLRFSFRGKGFAAEMALGPSGDFVVLSGPKARVRTTATTPRGTTVLRGMLIDKGVLSQVGDFLIFTSDYSFSSVSAAAAIVIGGLPPEKGSSLK